MERRGSMGLGHRGGQLRHLQEPHHGPVHRVPGQPGQRHQRGVHRGLGDVQPRLPLPLHLQVAEDPAGVPPGQQGLGVPEVRTLRTRRGRRRQQIPVILQQKSFSNSSSLY